MTGGGGGGGINRFWGGARTLFTWIRQCRSNEKHENQKKESLSHTILVCISKVFQCFTNSKLKIKTKKKSLRPTIYAKFHEIRYESTKITKKPLLLTNSTAISTCAVFRLLNAISDKKNTSQDLSSVAHPVLTLPITMPLIFAHIYLKQPPVPRAEPNDSS